MRRWPNNLAGPEKPRRCCCTVRSSDSGQSRNRMIADLRFDHFLRVTYYPVNNFLCPFSVPHFSAGPIFKQKNVGQKNRGGAAINHGERYASRRESTEQTEINGKDGKKTEKLPSVPFISVCSVLSLPDQSFITVKCRPTKIGENFVY